MRDLLTLRRILVAIATALALTVTSTALPLSASSTHLSTSQPARSLAEGHGVQGAANTSPFCREIDKTVWGSAGARMWCFPPRAASSTLKHANAQPPNGNVNAADPAEDVAPNGVRGYGQSETSVAAVGPYVVEAWNDITGFFAPCPAPRSQEESTGYGFSADGGASFVDEGGLPNSGCEVHRYMGDPSVEAWSAGGSAYFYISSLFNASTPDVRDHNSYIALTACKASGLGKAARLQCSQPIIVAASSECLTSGSSTVCSFLDKDFLTIDPQRGRLYVSYTEFGVQFNPPDNLAFGQVELAACDIGTPNGRTGPGGGTAGHPVCTPGGPGTARAPYQIIAPAPHCLNSGAYPAVDVARGDVYVAYESNLFNALPGCLSLPTQNVVTRVPFSCLTRIAVTSLCGGPAARGAANVVSMVAAPIPGYTRFPFQDFPRIAVSDRTGTVSMVWNDAARNPLGDVMLQSYHLGSLARVQPSPVRLNALEVGLHVMPGLRNANPDGTLNVSWYARPSPNSTLTELDAALNVSPLATHTPVKNTIITTAPTNWLGVVCYLAPNFGDYTDNYVMALDRPPYTGHRLYLAWSDGRSGIVQPYEASLPT